MQAPEQQPAEVSWTVSPAEAGDKSQLAGLYLGPDSDRDQSVTAQQDEEGEAADDKFPDSLAVDLDGQHDGAIGNSWEAQIEQAIAVATPNAPAAAAVHEEPRPPRASMDDVVDTLDRSLQYSSRHLSFLLKKSMSAHAVIKQTAAGGAPGSASKVAAGPREMRVTDDTLSAQDTV